MEGITRLLNAIIPEHCLLVVLYKDLFRSQHLYFFCYIDNQILRITEKFYIFFLFYYFTRILEKQKFTKY
jgi:hypothetical protein